MCRPTVSALFGYQPLQVVLLLVAFPLFIWKLRTDWRVLAVGLPVPIINVIMWGLYFDNSPRFWATVALFDCVICAYLIEEVIDWSVGTFKLRKPVVVSVAMLIIVGPAALQAVAPRDRPGGVAADLECESAGSNCDRLSAGSRRAESAACFDVPARGARRCRDHDVSPPPLKPAEVCRARD